MLACPDICATAESLLQQHMIGLISYISEVHLLIDFATAGFGAAYGTAKSGVGIASMGVMRPELVMKSIVPVVMAGVLGIYGLIIAVIISTGSEPPPPLRQCLPP